MACTGAVKEPRECNSVGFTQLPSCTVCARPPTSDDHNFLVRAPFSVFLDSMEIPLSLESININIDKIRTHIGSENAEKQ